ncbi:MAG: hypothetical protein L0323_20055, partial [Planctomycetes bacterium]|nr:hypothetical protein [Planctomycetota bacterium]
PGVPYAASFSARISGDSGRLRLQGILASAAEGRLRLEIAGGGRSFLLVSRGEETTAVLSPQGLFLHDRSGASLLEAITGVPLTAAEISSLLEGGEPALPDGCEARRWRMRTLGPAGALPGKIRVTCPRGRLDLSLRNPQPLDAASEARAFEPLAPPPRFREAGVEEVAAAIREALSGSS